MSGFLPPDHPLADLQAQAAVTSGWPVLHLDLDPAVADDVAARVERALGPLPQGELLEHADGVELRADLPGLDLALWRAASDALAAHDVAASLAPGVPPGARHARDLAYLLGEEHGDGDLVATAYIDPHAARPLRLDLARHAPDDALAPVAHALAVASADAGLAVVTDRGPDTVDAVVHRSSGRLGLELALAEHATDEDLYVWVGALADVVRAHADDPVARLAPDLHIERDLTTRVVVWLVAPARPLLPGATPVGPGVHVPPGWTGPVEVQLLPRALADHDAAVAHALPIARDAGLYGGVARWVPTPGDMAFAPTWSAPDVDPDALRRLGAALVDHPAVHAVRFAPRCPGDADGAAVRDPTWRVAPGGRAVLSWRDALTDDGHVPTLTARDADPDDADALGALPGEARPVAVDGRWPALAIRGLPEVARSDAGLDAILAALDRPLPAARWPLALTAWRRRGDAMLLLRRETLRSNE